MSREEEELRIKKLKEEIEVKKAKLNELQDKYFKENELEDIKKQYMNKFFVFRNNSYSCPCKKSDYWDVYYKVIDVDENGGIKTQMLEKDKYGNIRSEISVRGIGYLNLEEITENEYITETSKILGILEERFKNN